MFLFSGGKMPPVPVTKMNWVWDWVKKNLLLLLTFAGVIFGVIVGEYFLLSILSTYMEFFRKFTVKFFGN